METQYELTNSKQIIAYLATEFPNCFSLDGDAKPIKIGIFQDITSRLGSKNIISKTKLRIALRVYTMSWRYLYSIKEGAKRVDLDGNEGEMITQEQVEYARQQIKESKARIQKIRKNKNKNQPLPLSEPKKWKIGDKAKVIISRKPIDIQIIQIEKDHVRVKVASGMELTVKSDNIIS